MIAGDTITIRTRRQAADGQPAQGRAVTDFVVTVDGELVTPGGFTDNGTAVGSVWNTYSFTVVSSSTVGISQITIEPAQNSYVSDLLDPTTYTIDGESYDNDALANLMLTTQGIPSILSAADSNLGDIVDGDSYKSATLTMPSGKLSPFSITDISAAGITVEAAIRGSVAGTSYPITATVVSGPDLTFTIGWDTQQHPALTADQSASWFIDVQVIKTGPPKQIVTPNRYSFQQVWQRDPRTT